MSRHTSCPRNLPQHFNGCTCRRTTPTTPTGTGSSPFGVYTDPARQRQEAIQAFYRKETTADIVAIIDGLEEGIEKVDPRTDTAEVLRTMRAYLVGVVTDRHPEIVPLLDALYYNRTDDACPPFRDALCEALTRARVDHGSPRFTQERVDAVISDFIADSD